MAKPTNTTAQVDIHQTLHNQAVDVAMFGADPAGVADSTTAFSSALAASPSGKIKAGPGTFILNNWTPPAVSGGGGAGWSLEGSGFQTVLKAKTAAAAALSMVEQLHSNVAHLTIDGNAKASHGIVVKGSTTGGSQGHYFDHVKLQNCDKGLLVDTNTITQADKNIYIGCDWADNNTGLHVNTVNGQEQLLLGCTFDTHTTAIRLTHGTLTWISGQIQTYTTAFLIDGDAPWLNLTDIITEAGTTDLDGTTGWTVMPVVLTHCILQGTGNTVKMGIGGSVLKATGTQFNTGNISPTANDCGLVDEFCSFIGGATWNPTGVNDWRKKLSAGTETWYQGATQRYAINFAGQIGFGSHAVAGLPLGTYTVTNPTTDRALNVTADTLPQVAEVLGTLIADLQSSGLIN